MMLVNFGYLCMELQTNLADPLTFPCEVTAKESNIRAGGSAINQIIAAARSGAKASAIGIIGNDLFGKNIIETLRREGIQTSAIAKHDMPTGMINSITDNNGKTASIFMPGANEHISANQISGNALNERTILMLQNYIPASINLTAIKRAKDKGSRTLISITNSDNITAELFEYLDIAIVKDEVPLPANIKTKIIRTNYEHIAFDAFCGTFTACIQAGFNLKRAHEYADSAAIFTTEAKKLPYIDDIKSNIKAA